MNFLKTVSTLILISSVVISGCADMSRPSETQTKKEIRDLPMQTKRNDDAGPRQRLMVLPFLDSNNSRPQSLRDSARTNFIKDLNRTGDVIVVDSRDLKLDLTTLSQGGEYKMDSVAKAAAPLGAAAVLEGKLLDLKVRRAADEVGVFRQLKTTFECQVRVRIFATRSAKELYNTVKTVTIEESNVRVAEAVDTDRFFKNNPQILENLVKESFNDFNPQIIETLQKMAWEGRIAAISGDRIFLNVGRLSGLQIGDILKVTDDGDEVYDPQTGNFIGKVPGRLKGTIEVVSYFGQDGAIAIIHSGSSFKESDRVELY